jgi:trk system potassium uptake protein TrkH
MNGGYRAVTRDLGRMLRVLAAVIAVSVVVPLAWSEYYAVPALLASALVAFAVGRLPARRYTDAEDPGKWSS